MFEIKLTLHCHTNYEAMNELLDEIKELAFSYETEVIDEEIWED